MCLHGNVNNYIAIYIYTDKKHINTYKERINADKYKKIITNFSSHILDVLQRG